MMKLTPKLFKNLLTLACLVAFIVVILGAYTRLTQAGLGCPDWPGCYGHLVVPKNNQTLAPVDSRKAWTEMVHRYLAGILVSLIVIIAMIAIKYSVARHYPLMLLGLIIFQAALGMWTVTLKLLPVVVMGHLLGGLTILATLWWLNLSVHYDTDGRVNAWAQLAIVIVFVQIALGGWVSANYAGLACVGFPSCNGSLFPALDVTAGFNLFTAIGANYQGGLLDSAARVTIQMIHRYGALLTASYVITLSVVIFIKTHHRMLKITALAILIILLCQIILGILNVVLLLPLSVAVAHNAFAALTLLAVITLAFFTKVHDFHQKGPQC